METPPTTSTAANRPLYIGITARASTPDWLQRNVRNYLSMVASYRAVPVVLAPDSPAVLPDGTAFTPDEQGRLPAAVLHTLDGLILSGGGDVDPGYFGQELAGAELSSIDPRRDELELGLAQAALARDLPIFGICRGCQVLNVAAGGQMIQHLDGHRSPDAGPTRFHPVQVAPESTLHAIVRADEFTVNTFHHQGMDVATLAPGFRPAAVAQPDDWLVEAYESAEHRWVVGVQWHPERTFELDEPHLRLWDSFVAACHDRRNGSGG
jgi:putative glutamine amidotransferase